MENMKELNDEAVEEVTGGARINTTNPNGAHWQPTNVSMGTTFTRNGLLWYRIKPGDTLGAIASRFGTSVNTLKANNPATIRNINQIYAGDAIVIRRV